MINSKFSKRITVIALALVASFMLTAFFAVGASKTSASVYDDVDCIDAGATYYTLLEEAGEEEQMAAIVAVAAEINAFVAEYKEEDYLESDWSVIQKFIVLGKNYCKVKGETADGDNYYLNYAAFKDRNIDRIQTYISFADAILTKEERFAAAVAYAKDFLTDKVDDMLADTRIHAGAEIYEYRNMYDDAAQAEVAEYYTAGLAALNALVYDPSDYEGSVAAIDVTRDTYVALLNNVDRNDLERAYSAISDYNNIEFGDRDDEYADQTEKDAALAVAKAVADSYVDGAYDFYNAVKGVYEDKENYSADQRNKANQMLKSYTPHKAALDRYTEVPKEHDFSDIADKETLADEKGIVSVTAMVDGVATAVFPHDANVKIVDNTSSIYKLNAENEIVKKNRKISVAYCFDITIYVGTAKWEQVTEYEGKKVTYQVSVDLEKYYTECIANRESWVSKNLKVKNTGKDYLEKIKQCAADYADTSLCYHYLGRSQVDGETSAKLEGNVITFETPSFSNFAVIKAGGRGLFANPIFWFILILLIIIAFVAFVIVMSLIKYTISFESNGGSEVEPVKVRYHDYFSMPKAPTKDKFVFGGWYEDEALTLRFVDTCLLKRKSFTVYAKWNNVLTTTQADEIFGNLREMLASHAAISDKFEIDEGATVRLAKLAKLVNEGIEVKLYLALDPEKVANVKPYGIETAAEEVETPLLKNVDSIEAYEEAVALVNILIEQYELQKTEAKIPADSDTEYVLELTSADIVGEIVEEELVEEEPAEEVVEETAEEAIEEPEEEAAPTEEELLDYFKAIRTFAKGFALPEETDKIERNAVIMKALLREEKVEVYLKAEDPEAIGATVGEGVLANDTPAYLAIDSDEALETAKAAVKAAFEELGLEETGFEIDLGDSEAKSFAYRLKYEE